VVHETIFREHPEMEQYATFSLSMPSDCEAMRVYAFAGVYQEYKRVSSKGQQYWAERNGE